MKTKYYAVVVRSRAGQCQRVWEIEWDNTADDGTDRWIDPRDDLGSRITKYWVSILIFFLGFKKFQREDLSEVRGPRNGHCSRQEMKAKQSKGEREHLIRCMK